jgi:hypothetical protein
MFIYSQTFDYNFVGNWTVMWCLCFIYFSLKYIRICTNVRKKILCAHYSRVCLHSTSHPVNIISCKIFWFSQNLQTEYRRCKSCGNEAFTCHNVLLACRACTSDISIFVKRSWISNASKILRGVLAAVPAHCISAVGDQCGGFRVS